LRVSGADPINVHLDAHLIGPSRQPAPKIKAGRAVGAEFEPPIAVAGRHRQTILTNPKIRRLARRGAAGAAQPVAEQGGGSRASQPPRRLIIHTGVGAKTRPGRAATGDRVTVSEDQARKIRAGTGNDLAHTPHDHLLIPVCQLGLELRHHARIRGLRHQVGRLGMVVGYQI